VARRVALLRTQHFERWHWQERQGRGAKLGRTTMEVDGEAMKGPNARKPRRRSSRLAMPCGLLVTATSASSFRSIDMLTVWLGCAEYVVIGVYHIVVECSKHKPHLVFGTLRVSFSIPLLSLLFVRVYISPVNCVTLQC
jgi:hypothetical protein